MRHTRWVVAITKRTAELCATQAVLSEFGIELLAIPDIPTAFAAMGALRFEAAIVCRHSWSDEERDRIAADLSVRPGLKYVMRCPGCTEAGEAPAAAGTLPDNTGLVNLVAAIEPADRKVQTSDAA